MPVDEYQAVTEVLVPKEASETPRLKLIVEAAMKKAGLATSWEHTVVDLATGRLSRSTLRCCGSGCRPCVQDVQRCVGRVVTAWNDPQFELRLLESADGSVSGRTKRLAKRVLRKLGG